MDVRSEGTASDYDEVARRDRVETIGLRPNPFGDVRGSYLELPRDETVLNWLRNITKLQATHSDARQCGGSRTHIMGLS